MSPPGRARGCFWLQVSASVCLPLRIGIFPRAASRILFVTMWQKRRLSVYFVSKTYVLNLSMRLSQDVEAAKSHHKGTRYNNTVVLEPYCTQKKWQGLRNTIKRDWLVCLSSKNFRHSFLWADRPYLIEICIILFIFTPLTLTSRLYKLAVQTGHLFKLFSWRAWYSEFRLAEWCIKFFIVQTFKSIYVLYFYSNAAKWLKEANKEKCVQFWHKGL